jgi:hypothetical protein
VKSQIGLIALLGSGETSLSGGRIFDTIARQFPQPLRIAILETPAGFELNSAMVARRVGDFLEARLQNYHPRIDIIPARKRGSSFSPDDMEILHPLIQADIIFMGPGSPTYAVRQLKGSLAWDLIRARHRLGAALVFASAAVIAVGAHALPVYEIFKVGEDVSIPPGLDLFADFGLMLSLIPHWNNTDGGDEVDTSRCFIGIERFNQWCDLLPPGHTTLGMDEHTGIIINFAIGKCTVIGVSSITLMRTCNPVIFPSGAEFPISELGDFRKPVELETGNLARLCTLIREAEQADGHDGIPNEIFALAEKRRQARLRQNWTLADVFRQQMAALGWVIQDTPDGQKIIRQS